jgi:hypothetical protein
VSIADFVNIANLYSVFHATTQHTKISIASRSLLHVAAHRSNYHPNIDTYTSARDTRHLINMTDGFLDQPNLHSIIIYTITYHSCPKEIHPINHSKPFQSPIYYNKLKKNKLHSPKYLQKLPSTTAKHRGN